MIKSSELLRRARDIHARRTMNGSTCGCLHMGICHSIELAVRGLRQDRIARALIARVQVSINPYSWVHTWLVVNEHARTTPSAYAITQYRLRWLEALAAEYEAKGD